MSGIFLFQMLVSQSFISYIGPTQVEISLTNIRHTTFKGTLVNPSVVEKPMFCVYVSMLSFVVPEM